VPLGFSDHPIRSPEGCNIWVCVHAAQLEADEGEKAKEEALSKEFQDVVDFLKKSLAERVEKVTVSNR